MSAGAALCNTTVVLSAAVGTRSGLMLLMSVVPAGLGNATPPAGEGEAAAGEGDSEVEGKLEGEGAREGAGAGEAAAAAGPLPPGMPQPRSVGVSCSAGTGFCIQASSCRMVMKYVWLLLRA